MIKDPSISVIISTYNSIPWLEKTLWSYEHQIFRQFEIVIADDGSNDETKEFIKKYSEKSSKKIIHVWHEDNGFQKSMILNKALSACNAEYVVMSDGDCIAREDFLQIHYERREHGYFLSGGYYKLPLELSQNITEEDIATQRCFNANWLRSNGLPASYKNQKLTSGFVTAKIMENLTPTNASWNGHNSSGWLVDLKKVNGFDERMQYGGQDRELGERLFNLGIKSKQIRYSAICLHLDHARGYKNQESIDKNKAIRKATRGEKKDYTPYGIVKESK
ncbi:glycosyl transferase family 2 [Nonlabens xylanidelens]|uniref:Glycosyl transferase family 2 n=1 Tax=Nonlabens xylanidelens TaxID=191564 RepID=A0A2S6IHH3_9FLAO|nr:glycosyltransferase [Nonlabens xylanidelens]PPK93664.1 glycosyl transferase family 2 [Nonlabens xylanidelens]PQJ17757.1 glycosyl transferase family 2 [Nonlabens xylanidelens]